MSMDSKGQKQFSDESLSFRIAEAAVKLFPGMTEVLQSWQSLPEHLQQHVLYCMSGYFDEVIHIYQQED